jgi:hypothetical protein
VLCAHRSRLAYEGFKFATKVVCRDEKVWVLACFGLFGPFFCWQTRQVCNQERFITDAWKTLNNTLPNLQQKATSKAIDLNAALQEKQIAETNRIAAETLKASLAIQIQVAQRTTAVALGTVGEAKRFVDELDAFIKDILPDLPVLEISKPGQWVPKEILLVVDFRVLTSPRLLGHSRGKVRL